MHCDRLVISWKFSSVPNVNLFYIPYPVENPRSEQCLMAYGLHVEGFGVDLALVGETGGTNE